MKVAIDFIKKHRFWFKLGFLVVAGIIGTLVVLSLIERAEKSAFERGQAQEAAARIEWQRQAEAHRAEKERLQIENAKLEGEASELRETIKQDIEELAKVKDEEITEKRRANVERGTVVNIPASMLCRKLCEEFRAIGKELPAYCTACQ